MAEHTEIVEKALWIRLKNGDEAALADIYTLFIDSLLNYGTSITDDKELIRDSIQELFINLWSQRRNLTVPGSARSYLIISLKRTVLKNISKERKKEKLYIHYLDGLEQFETDTQNHIIADEQKQETGKMLYQHISNLPVRQREIIHLRFYQELSYEEISLIMNLKNQGVRNLVYKALQALRKQVAVPNIFIIFLLMCSFSFSDKLFLFLMARECCF